MNVFVITALIGLVLLAWLWSEKSDLKRTTARTWLASRGKTVAKPKLATPS
jgi:hypothetical protein